jgi:hypothetical protein
LSDERIIVRELNGVHHVFGTPYPGLARYMASPEHGPLKGIFMLRQTPQNQVRRLNPVDAAAELVSCSFPPIWSVEGMGFTMDFAERLCRQVPCYELGFVPDPSVIPFVRSL